MLHGIADLDATDTVRLLEATLRRRRQAEVDDLLLVLHYADLHSAIPAERGPGGEQLGDLGGDGAPAMAELAIVVLAVDGQVPAKSARAAAADGLHLLHRMPRVLDKAMSLEA